MKDKVGRVFLIGAGPGDLGLLTLNAVDALKNADVIIYDRLVPQGWHRYANPSARKINAGKTSGRSSTKQTQINRLLANHALAGRTVARLKGGDPLVFGRGAEEAEYLSERNIPFTIIPGVSSITGVPGNAGIPLTHRRVSSSVAIVTGHEDPSKRSSSVRWGSLARAVDTLVVLMGAEKLEQITQELMQSGLPKATPCAVIVKGTSKDEVVLTGPLKNIAARVRKLKLTPPALLIVGKVVELRRRFLKSMRSFK